MVRSGGRARAGGGKACTYEAGQAAAPRRNVGLVAIWIGRPLAVEVGVKSRETSPREPVRLLSS